MTIDLCHDCGGGSYLLAAMLTGIAFMGWKGGLWVARQEPDGRPPIVRRGIVAMLWLVALLAARGAWVALG